MSGMENLELLLWITPALSAGLAAALWFRYVSGQCADVTLDMSGFAAARQILDAAGLVDVSIEPTPGNLSDHYESARRTVWLGNAVYHGRSVVAISLAAHIAGHALQHRASPPACLLQNMAAVGASFGSGPGLLIAIFGVISGLQPLVVIGIVLFYAAFALQVVCLPLRWDACRRAQKYLAEWGQFDPRTATCLERIMRASVLMGLAVVLQPLTAVLDSILRFFGG